MIKMNIVSTATIELDTVKEILMKAIERETGHEVKDLQFVHGVRSVGYGRDEHDETYLQHVHVVFEMDKSPKPGIPTKRGEGK